MAINLRCPVCKSEHGLEIKKCHKCGNNLIKNRKYKVSVKLPNGRTLKKQVDTLELAKKVEAKFRTQSVEQGVFSVFAPPSIDEAWKKYLAWARQNKASWKDDEYRWVKHVQPRLKGKRMDQVAPTDIDGILCAMQAGETPQGKPYAPATRKQVLVLVRRVFNWARGRKLYAGENPAQVIDIPKFDNQVTRCLKDAEVDRLLSTCDGWKNRRAALAVLFALYTGQRQGQILKLQWGDVDMEAGQVHFRADTMKGKRHHMLPANAAVVEILKEAQACAVPGSPYVFPSSTGGHMLDFKKIWVRIKRRAGLPEDFRFHDLRHSFASYLASSGKVDIFLLQNLLGHQEIRMTQRYAHLLNGALRKGAEVSAEIFKRRSAI